MAKIFLAGGSMLPSLGGGAGHGSAAPAEIVAPADSRASLLVLLCVAPSRTNRPKGHQKLGRNGRRLIRLIPWPAPPRQLLVLHNGRGGMLLPAAVEV